MYTVEEVCQRLGIPRSTLYLWVQQGKVEALGGKLLITEDEAARLEKEVKADEYRKGKDS